ncbi:nuclear transport factor 2 family protein [Pseudomonas citronellolis]|jgi:ketosteroid isomerase-like protein|uniref:nuclear transport factor 2 family protein n=1 Tax=Pseudomonas citronellolis TaxID=53408 RepID=UPI0018D7FDAD|nr:nuclear transport factor 2 family protein [Pseudomonas citronellolis]MBH3437036.1 nuclear transport factor 2 family protein [Pseudomonas citronellolis]WAB90816.1 nuclear transport factor 2 family protein [Pseudomonas citronellolis]
MNDIRSELLALERERQRVLVEEDHAGLERLFADDLLYVHTTGLVQDKAQYLDYARHAVRYLAVARGELQVRLFGDGLALMSGPQCNLLQKRGGGEPVRAEGFATQLWVKEEAGWRIASFHGTRVLA